MLGMAERVLNEFQEIGGYNSQSDALSGDLLQDYGRLEERVDELEAQLAKARGN